jgi:hypothetical protein
VQNEGNQAVSRATSSISAFPNPNNGQFTLQLQGFAEGNVVVTILDSEGRAVRVQDVLVGATTQYAKFNVSGLAAGTYFVRATDGKQAQSTKVIVTR